MDGLHIVSLWYLGLGFRVYKGFRDDALWFGSESSLFALRSLGSGTPCSKIKSISKEIYEKISVHMKRRLNPSTLLPSELRSHALSSEDCWLPLGSL